MIGTYLVKMCVYLFSMVGVCFLAYLVWRQVALGRNSLKKSSMQIEDSLNLSPRKTLFIIRIKDERFLIASDIDKTTFLAKLKNDENIDLTKIELPQEVAPQQKDKAVSQAKGKVASEKKIAPSKEIAPKIEDTKILKPDFKTAINEVKSEDIEKIKEKPINILRELTKKRSM